MANRPVRSASVQITWDETHVIVSKTDANGTFLREIQLPPGRHTVIAGFSGEGYPINASESEPRIADIPLIRGLEPDNGPVWLVISVIGIFLLFLGAAVFYLWRMAKRRSPVPGTSRDEDFPADTDSGLPQTGGDHKNQTADSGKPGKETLIAYYTRLLREQGLNAASRKIYELFAGHIAHDLSIKRHRTLTAREMSRNCRGKPYCGAFARFIAVYERVRYGGQVTVKDQAVFETAIHVTDEQMGGENH
jgi:hypothetical protein